MTDNTNDPADRLDRLTAAQKQCLRLVLAHLTSKEIGRALGISPHTVDAHLKATLRTLGVSNRTEAALMLAAQEGPGPYQSVAYQSLGMANPLPDKPISPHRLSAADDVDYSKLALIDDEHNRNIVHDKVAGFADFGTKFPDEERQHSLGKRRFLDDVNRLPIHVRLACIVALSIVSILAFALMISALQALSSFYG